MASVKESAAVTGDIDIGDGADSHEIPPANISPTSETHPRVVSDDESLPGKDAGRKTPRPNIDFPCGTTYPIPATLNIEDDCVVSAVRVESKFSDEDDSLGKDGVCPSESDLIAGETACRHPTEAPSPTEIEEEEPGRGEENDDDDEDGDGSWSVKENSGETVWNDSEDEEENQKAGFGRNTVLANRRSVPEVDDDVSSAGEDDPELNKEAFGDEKRRSSWGSSLGDSDNDLPREDDIKETPEENRDEGAGNVIEPESGWDSSSKNDDHTDICPSVKGDELPPGSKTNMETPPTEQQGSDGCPEEAAKDCFEKESRDLSPPVSPIPEDENNTRNQLQDNSDARSIGPSSQREGKQDSENEGEDDSWDDDDESGESERQKAKEEGDALKTVETGSLSPKKRPPFATEMKLEEVAEGDGEEENNHNVVQSTVDKNEESSEDNRLEADTLADVDKYDPSKDDDSSEDSDSMDQQLQYDFASGTVKVSDVGNDSDDAAGEKLEDEDAARLTAYVPLENRAAAAPQAEEKEQTLSRPLTTGATAGQNCDAERNLSDDSLPQTDIDDVDLDSPDEEKSVSLESKEVRKVKRSDIQVKLEYDY